MTLRLWSRPHLEGTAVTRTKAALHKTNKEWDYLTLEGYLLQLLAFVLKFTNNFLGYCFQTTGYKGQNDFLAFFVVVSWQEKIKREPCS